MIERGRVSVLLPTGGCKLEDLIAIGHLVADLGFRGIAVGDVAGWNPVAVLAILAARLGRGILSSSIISLASSSVAQIAMAAATLAECSNGRFVLGVGVGSPITAGWHDRDGLPGMQDLSQALTRIRALLSGSPDPGARARPRFRLTCPPRYPVPIHVGSVGPHGRDLACAAGDGLVTLMAGPARLAKLAPTLAAKAEVHRRPRPHLVAIQWIAPPEGGADASHMLALESLSYFMTRGYAQRLDPDVRERLGTVFTESGRVAASGLLPRHIVEEIGTSAQRADVESRIEDLLAAGADEVRLHPLGDGSKNWFSMLCSDLARNSNA